MPSSRSSILVEVLKEYQNPEASTWDTSLETLQELLAEFQFESATLKSSIDREEDLDDFAKQMLRFMGMWAGAARREAKKIDITESGDEDLVVLDPESGLGTMSWRFQLINEFMELDKEFGFVENPSRFSGEEYKDVLSKFRSRYADFIAKFMDNEFNRSIVSRPKGFQPVLDKILGTVIFEGFAKYVSEDTIHTGEIAAFSHYSANLIRYWGGNEPFRDAARGMGEYE
jgi:hypothetical protein